MSVLRPITDDEYAAWVAAVVPEYAADKIAAGQWSDESALELAQEEYQALLPQGKATENNHIYTVLSTEGVPVGTLWFVAKDRAKQRIAYVYVILIAPEHRRQGHALLAFKALEHEVARQGLSGIALHVFGHNHAAKALYAKLGYVATNINLFKPVKGTAADGS